MFFCFLGCHIRHLPHQVSEGRHSRRRLRRHSLGDMGGDRIRYGDEGKGAMIAPHRPTGA